MHDDTFQERILNASDTCSNCFARQRRDAVRPRNYDPDEIYSERIRAQTTVEDVPDAAPSEAGTLFCRCGAHKHHTRIWDDDDVDRERLTELVINTLRTLDGKGYRVDSRRVAEVARAHFGALRRPEFGPFERAAEYGAAWRRTPSSINDVLAAAVDAGASRIETASPSSETTAQA